VATLFPGYFALVMATGIIATAAAQQGLDVLPEVLYALAATAYVVLAALTVLRLVRHPRRLLADLTSHSKGFAFLTMVAATNVLGAASGLVHGWWDLTRVLWWVGLGLWLVLLYTALISVVILGPKPGLTAGINGTWFLLTVSTESIASTGGLLLGRDGGDLLAFTCLAAFLLGITLYLIVMTMVFLRWTFNELEPTEADPPAWIAAGAVAITVLAGSNLLGAAAASTRIDRLVPVLEVLVVLAWATATFWFPLMVAIGIWRHVVRRVPLRYHPAYWALVFPLGMYSAATERMRLAVDLEPLAWVPELALGVALAAWAATTVGLASTGLRALRPPSSAPEGG
jgi:tellurite resistance protein TehA-like permease